MVVVGMILFPTVFLPTYSFGPGELPEKTRPAIVGDSFAGYFLKFFKDYSFDYYNFPRPTIVDNFNVSLFLECIHNKENGFILFSTGVNDQAYNTNIAVFETVLRNLVDEAKKYNKYIFFHTYMDMYNPKKYETHFQSKDYDEVLKKIANDYKNVIYIDMKNFESRNYIQSDNMHYNKEFYESLRAKFNYEIRLIERKQYGLISDWDLINKSDEIIVTGDSYAGTFYDFEHDRDFSMNLYAIPNKTLSNNSLLILAALNTSGKYALLSISVNDFNAETIPFDFEKEVRKFANESMNNNKILFLHSYMNFPLAATKVKKYRVSEYDEILRKIANEYANVYYIDMSDCEDAIFCMADMIHYGKEFQDILYDRIKTIISDQK